MDQKFLDISPFFRTSLQIDKIAKAFSSAQKKLKPVEKRGRGNYGEYVLFDDCLKEVKEAFESEGISIIQNPTLVSSGAAIIGTMFLHAESGQWFYGECSIPADKPTAQGAGSAFTYGKRYSLSAMAGVSADTDDDGQHASQNPQEWAKSQSQSTQSQAQANPPSNEVKSAGGSFSKPKDPTRQITEKQQKFGYVAGKKAGWTEQEMSEFTTKMYGITNWKYCSMEIFDHLLKTMQNMTFAHFKENSEFKTQEPGGEYEADDPGPGGTSDGELDRIPF